MNSAARNPNNPSPACSYVDKRRSTHCHGTFYRRLEDKSYCVLHLPLENKVKDFNLELERKLKAKDYDFRGAWFPRELDLAQRCFEGEALFSDAVFMKGADFSCFKFAAAAEFTRATFIGIANFRHAEFNLEARFHRTTFKNEADFSSARFGKEANFNSARFEDYVRFSGDEQHPIFGDQSSLDLQYSRIEKPDHVHFHSVKLYPHWFISVNARKFDFINVEWVLNHKDLSRLPLDNIVGYIRRHIFRYGFDLEQEAKYLEDNSVPSPYHSLSIAYRQLAVNEEENHRYRDASHLRYRSMNAQRLDITASGKDTLLPASKYLAYLFYCLHLFYWALSGYGERIVRAVGLLILILVLFSGLYTMVGFSQQPPTTLNETATAPMSEDKVGKPLEWQRAFFYSLGRMSLQKPEPRPVTNAAQAFVVLETIFGPVQVALLALAIRRRFMVSG